MKNVLIMGRGPSVSEIKNIPRNSYDSVILINNHAATMRDKGIVDILKTKDVYVICNITQSGFVPQVLETINVKSCIINRLMPNWKIFRENKNKQRKNYEGGNLNNLGRLPFLAEDEPYMYSWRGPDSKNKAVMKTYNSMVIEHMPDEAEQYIIPTVKDKLICNCSYYATLYAIIKLGVDNITYCGVDFYNHKKIDKKWFLNPPKYLSSEWWDLRLKYEGEHMKVLFNKHLSSLFPSVIFSLHTTEDFKSDCENIFVKFLKKN